MSKYRVVQIQTVDQLYYQVEMKCLFWWFIQYQYYGLTYRYRFDTAELATAWIEKQVPTRRTIVSVAEH